MMYPAAGRELLFTSDITIIYPMMIFFERHSGIQGFFVTSQENCFAGCPRKQHSRDF